jgi:hypothetical protein
MFPLKKSREKPTPNKHTENEGTKNKHKKTTKNTTPNLLYKPGKIHKV